MYSLNSYTCKHCFSPKKKKIIATIQEDDDDDDQPHCNCTHCRISGKKITEVEILHCELTEKRIHKLIELKFEGLIKELEEFMAIQSVSRWMENLDETVDIMDLMATKLGELHFDVKELLVNPNHPTCEEAPLQKILLANFFTSPAKCTLLIYAHLDVFPALKKDGWYHNPLELFSKGGTLYAAGINYGKGPAICWLNAIQVWMNEKNDLPINIKFVVECMHEIDSEGLEKHIEENQDFFTDVDYMVFPASTWLNRDKPVISCSLCGWMNIGVELRGGNKTVDSGSVGGMVYEPMTDICRLMNSLVDNQQTVLVPLLNQDIRPLNAHEWELLEGAEFGNYDYMDKLNVRRLRHQLSKPVLLQQRFCNSSLCMHGVEGCYIESGSELSTPLAVMGKLSIKLIPNQSVQSVFQSVEDFLKVRHRVLNIHSEMRIHLLDCSDPIGWEIHSTQVEVLKRAVISAYKVVPAMTQNICTCMRVANRMHNLTKKKIIILPWTKRPEIRHPINESISENCYMTNIQMCASLMHELSLLPPKCKCNLIKGYCNQLSMTKYKHMKRADDRLSPLQKEIKPVKSNLKKSKKSKKKKKSSPRSLKSTRSSISYISSGNSSVQVAEEIRTTITELRTSADETRPTITELRTSADEK